MSFNIRCVVRAVAMLLAVATLASAQSLAEVARKEEARRKNLKQPSKVIKNEDVKQVPRPPAPPAATPADSKPAQPADAKPAAADPNAAQGKPAEPQPGQKNDQKYWHDRITSAREALERNRFYADATQTRINSLTADFVNRDDPAQRAVIGSDRQKALAELDRLKKEIERQTKDITAIEEEARKAGVPLGWLR